MKKMFFLILIMLSTLTFAQEVKTKTGIFPAEEMNVQKRKIVEMVVSEISRTLPQIIDKYTTLTAIKAKGATMIYYFEINTGSKSDESVIREDHSRMKKAVTKGICQASVRFINAKINIIYIYKSVQTQSELFRFDISQKDCIGI